MRAAGGACRPARAAVFVALGAVLAAAVARAAPPSVEFTRGRLTVHARQTPAAELLTAVAAQTRIRFVVDSEIRPGPVSIDLERVPIERAVRTLAAQLTGAAGHTVRFARDRRGRLRLTQVTIYGAGKAPGGGPTTVYAAPTPAPEPAEGEPAVVDLQERLEKMIASGVPRATAEKVVALAEDVQRLQATPPPGSYRPEDLPPATREQVEGLVDRGYSVEQAVQILLLQERYQETLRELTQHSAEAQAAAPALDLPEPPPGS